MKNVCKKKDTWVFIATLFITTSTRKQYKWYSVDEQRLWCVYSIQYYSAHIGNEVLMPTLIWMNIKSLILNEKPISKDNLLYDFIFVTPWKIQKYRNRNVINFFQVGYLWNIWPQKDNIKTLMEIMELVSLSYILNVVCPYESIKSQFYCL